MRQDLLVLPRTNNVHFSVSFRLFNKCSHIFRVLPRSERAEARLRKASVRHGATRGKREDKRANQPVEDAEVVSRGAPPGLMEDVLTPALVLLEGDLGEVALGVVTLLLRTAAEADGELVVMALCLQVGDMTGCVTFRPPGVRTILTVGAPLTAAEAGGAAPTPDTDNTGRLGAGAGCNRDAGGLGTPLSGVLTSMVVLASHFRTHGESTPTGTDVHLPQHLQAVTSDPMRQAGTPLLQRCCWDWHLADYGRLYSHASWPFPNDSPTPH